MAGRLKQSPALSQAFRRLTTRLDISSARSISNAIWIVLSLALLGQSPALAGERLFTFKGAINGDSPTAVGDGTWLTALITDISNGVTIEFKANLLNNEFINNVGFNLADAPPLPIINRNNVTCNSGCTGFDWEYSTDGVSIDEWSVVSANLGVGGKVSGFDIGFLFGNNVLKGNVLNSTSTTSTITITGAVNAAMFDTYTNYGSVPVADRNPGWIYDLKAAAKVKNTNPEGSGEISGSDPPPNEVPGPLPLLGAVSAFQASRRLRRRLKPTTAAALRSA